MKFKKLTAVTALALLSATTTVSAVEPTTHQQNQYHLLLANDNGMFDDDMITNNNKPQFVFYGYGGKFYDYSVVNLDTGEIYENRVKTNSVLRSVKFTPEQLWNNESFLPDGNYKIEIKVPVGDVATPAFASFTRKFTVDTDLKLESFNYKDEGDVIKVSGYTEPNTVIHMQMKPREITTSIRSSFARENKVTVSDTNGYYEVLMPKYQGKNYSPYTVQAKFIDVAGNSHIRQIYQ
ncbi:Ig-like domain-containing protein [Vibrio parahaemolyticus]|uniref:hypothetical protein n=1 Tax=Vibrio parahaemolyticus TaxID=670 RepID=UPI00226AE4F0|nr:hypothetical protein [Vibrio parahaemolyticus]MCX8796065.1 hypothetical protein [Vibrio parahaemolyticus]